EDARSAAAFVDNALGGARVDLVAFHHSLYYAPASEWPGLLSVVMEHVLSTPGAIHAVLMAKASDGPHTTTWLYNHFAGRFFCHVNLQCLREIAAELRGGAAFRGAAVTVNTPRVSFHAPDFESL